MKIEKTKEQQQNDLFYLCSLIEYIGRKTKNPRGRVVEALGPKELKHICNFADVYHCENIEKVATEFIEKHDIKTGSYDNTKNLGEVAIPTFWDIGKVYSRMIYTLSADNTELIQTLISVYTSWIAAKIDNYRSSMYYENNSYLTSSFIAGHIQ